MELFNSGKWSEAVELLNLASELFPDEARLYNAVGEIYLRRGKGYFQKALKVDPTFEPARRRLKEIR